MLDLIMGYLWILSSNAILVANPEKAGRCVTGRLHWRSRTSNLVVGRRDKGKLSGGVLAYLNKLECGYGSDALGSVDVAVDAAGSADVVDTYSSDHSCVQVYDDVKGGAPAQVYYPQAMGW